MSHLKLRCLAMAINLLFVTSAFAQETLSEQLGTQASYPLSLSARPFTLPGGVAEIGGKMKIATSGDPVSLDFIHMGFGITDNLQLGASWGGLNFPGLNPARFVNANAGLFLFANSWMASMASVEVPIHFEGETFRNVTFALPTALPIVKGVSIITLYDSLVDFRFANKSFKASFNLPVALSIQMTPRLALDVSTRLAKFDLDKNFSSTFVWQDLPIRVKGLYAINNAFDVIASAGLDNCYEAKKSFSFTLGAQFRIGSLG